MTTRHVLIGVLLSVLLSVLLCLAGCSLGSQPPLGLDVGRRDGGVFRVFQSGDPVAVEAGVQGGHHITLATLLSPPGTPGGPAEITVDLRYPGEVEPLATSMYLRDTAEWSGGDQVVLDAIRVLLPSRESVVGAEVIVEITVDTGDAWYRGEATVQGVPGDPAP